jgi:hypothetical protein
MDRRSIHKQECFPLAKSMYPNCIGMIRLRIHPWAYIQSGMITRTPYHASMKPTNIQRLWLQKAMQAEADSPKAGEG